MISFEEALRLVLETSQPLPVVRVPLSRLHGRVLAEGIEAPFALPRFDNSSVDGYGFAAKDTIGVSRSYPLTVNPVRTVHAGEQIGSPLGRGESVKIMTGAHIPSGVDAVIMREEIESEGGLFLTRPAKPGENIRRRGEELHEGETILRVGDVVTPPVIGLLATCGLQSALVYRTPRVALLVTGDELAMPGEAIKAGQIYDANGPGLTAALSNFGIRVKPLTIPDDRVRLREKLKSALDTSDLVVTVGGVSVGDHDYIRSTLDALGVHQIFWRVAMKPGKPTYFGEYAHPDGHRALVFGLPGNPVAALLAFELLAKPVLRQQMGHRNAKPAFKKGISTEMIKRSSDRAEFVRGKLNWDGLSCHVTPFNGQESHMLASLAKGDCLIYLPLEVDSIQSGEIVDYIELNAARG